MVSDDVLRQSAFALDAVLLEACFILGPLITGALVAIGSPAAAVLANAAFSTIGTLVFAASRASRAWRGTPSTGIGAARFAPPGPRPAVHRVRVRDGDRRDGDLGHGVRDPTRLAGTCGNPDRRSGGREHGRRALVRVEGAPHSGGRALSATLLLIALGFAPLFLIGSMASALPLMALSGFAFAPAGAVLYL